MSMFKVENENYSVTIGDDGVVTASQGVVAPVTGDVTGDVTAATTTILKNSAGDILIAEGTTVPTDTTTGYAKGCLFIDTDVASGTTGLYVNVGTNTSCVFKAVTNAA